MDEPIRLVGIPLGPPGGNLWLTKHLEWYPTERVSAGHLLLASHGLDIALLDEVQQRKPFVEATVSREGEAFYGCLQAIVRIPTWKLRQQTLKVVTQRSAEQRARQQDLLVRYETLRRQQSGQSNNADQKQEVESARREYALASAVAERGEQQLSSVAPLFWHPNQHVGKLVRIAGTARRAVRVEVSPEQVVGELDHYYEMEIFTIDSQNLPIVCCVVALPGDFPVGDQIRVAVDISGIFFKNWRYRTREKAAPVDAVASERHSFTPVILGSKPIWLHDDQASTSPWGIWGGVVFLAILGGVWWVLLRQERRDRALRAAAPSAEFTLPESPSATPASSSHQGTTE